MAECEKCGDSGYVEFTSGGFWTGENMSSRQELCDCACGDDARDQENRTGLHAPMTPAPEIIQADRERDNPRRVQLKRTKDWRMPENTVKVTRPGIFGNPWTVKAAIEVGYSADGAPALCVGYFRDWLTGPDTSLTRMLENSDHLRNELIAGLSKLRGKNLACFCPLDAPCHADVLLELANAQTLSGDNPHD